MEASFEKLLVILAEGGVRFLVVGGVAVALQGYVRLTEHVDLLIDDAPDNLDRFLKILASYGEGFARELSTSDFTAEEGAIRVVEESEQMQIDIFTQIRGRRLVDVLADADHFELRGRTIIAAIIGKSAGLRLKAERVARKSRY